MILVVAFALGLLTVPLAGGSLRRLGDLRLRRSEVLVVALVLQLAALKLPLPHDAARALNLSTYLLGAWYLVANLRVAGAWIMGAGGACNLLAVVANGGVMPASAKALAAAGLSTGAAASAESGGSAGFVNSAVVPDAELAWLGDIFSIPRAWPLANVFSIGDVVILVGGLVVAHRLCGSRLLPTPARWAGRSSTA